MNNLETALDLLNNEIKSRKKSNDYIFEKNKLYDYLSSSYLVSILKKYKAYIAGGCITSIFTNKEINDVDIYFRCKEDAGNFIGELIEDSTWIVSHTNKATAFTYNNNTLQVIHFDYFKTAQDIFDKFDFTVCMGAFDFESEEFVLHKDFLKHNSQRILKFNENTAYPIISALRVQKYENKGYKISKPEYIKVLLTCMNLKINNYDELKEQMGGMYGVNYDKIIEPKEGEEFNLNDVIDKLSDLVVSDDYFKKPESLKLPNDINNLVYKISGIKIKVVEFKDNYYEFINGSFNEIDKPDFEKDDMYKSVKLKSIITKGTKLYKFVKKVIDGYLSYHDSNFEYRLGKEVVANKPTYHEDSYGIYCGFIEDVDSFSYNSYKDNTLLELEVLDDTDILDIEGSIRLGKALVVREVPKEEYSKYRKE